MKGKKNSAKLFYLDNFIIINRHENTITRRIRECDILADNFKSWNQNLHFIAILLPCYLIQDAIKTIVCHIQGKESKILRDISIDAISKIRTYT